MSWPFSVAFQNPERSGTDTDLPLHNTSREATERSQVRQSLRWLVVAACLLLAFQIGTIAAFGHGRIGVICSDAVQETLGFACVFAYVNVFHRSTGDSRFSWLLLCCASVLWVVAQSVSLIVDLSNWHSLDTLGGLIFFFSLIPIGILPFLDLTSDTRAFDRLHYLDFTQLAVTWISGSLYFSAKVWSLHSAFHIGPFTWSREIAFAGLVAVMMLCRGLLTSSRAIRSFFVQMAAFLLLSGLADSYMLRPEGDVQPGGWFDVVWCGLLLLPIMIASRWHEQGDHAPETPSKLQFLATDQLFPVIYPIISVFLLDRVDHFYPVVGPALMATALVIFATRSVVIQSRHARTEAALKIDVEQRIKAEQGLRISETKYRELFEHSPYGIYLSSSEGRLLEANSALVTMLGYGSREELLSEDLNKVYECAEDRQEARRRCERPGGVDVVQVNFRRKNGDRIVVQLNGRCIRDADGATVGFEVIVEDITERQKLERQFLQAQKMDAVGRLAGGVAHDFNNVLGVILGYTELLKPTFPAEDARSKQLREIEKAGKRAASLTRQLLAFSRQQVIQPVVLNLNSVVMEMERMLRRLIGEDIDLTIALEPALGSVRADRGQVEQVLMNLAVNSRDAMPKGGSLVISTNNAELDEAYTSQHSFAKPGKYISLSVSDNGCGIPKELQSHIFEPFFTTKQPGQGTGLGLSTVYGIIKQSQGHVSLYSEPGTGTTFKIYLPLVEERAEPGTAAENVTSLSRGTETVLLVEDQPDLLELTQTCLTRQGYRVFSARNGEAALELAGKHPGEVNLLLTDLVMPGMSGRDLAQMLLRTQAGMKVLYMSGYTRDLITKHGVLDADVFLLEKPFTIDSLCRRVRQVLDPMPKHQGAIAGA